MTKGPTPIDVTGQKFGRWTVLGYAGSRPKGGARWLCRCDCGTKREVDGTSLRSGKSASCGCTIREATRSRALKHGNSMGGDRLYTIWGNMRSRCFRADNPSYSNYGGRGIRPCPEWDDFAVFRTWALSAGYADDLTLERIDNDGGYKPSNCCWRTRAAQNRNRRNNRGPIAGLIWIDVARRHGVSASAYYTRVRRGWSEAVAATTPPLKAGRRVSAEEWASR